MLTIAWYLVKLAFLAGAAFLIVNVFLRGGLYILEYSGRRVRAEPLGPVVRAEEIARQRHEALLRELRGLRQAAPHNPQVIPGGGQQAQGQPAPQPAPQAAAGGGQP